MEVINGKDYLELWTNTIYIRRYGTSINMDWSHIQLDSLNDMQTSWSERFLQLMVF